MVERDPLSCEVAAPDAGAYAFGEAERREPQSLEQPLGDRFLSRRQTAPDLLGRDCAHPRLDPRGEGRDREAAAERPRRASMSTVESSSSRATRQPARRASVLALGPNPACGVDVPVVARVGKLAERGFDVVPPSLVLETAADELGDERAAAAGADPAIQVLDELVVQRNVQTHGRG